MERARMIPAEGRTGGSERDGSKEVTSQSPLLHPLSPYDRTGLCPPIRSIGSDIYDSGTT